MLALALWCCHHDERFSSQRFSSVIAPPSGPPADVGGLFSGQPKCHMGSTSTSSSSRCLEITQAAAKKGGGCVRDRLTAHTQGSDAGSALLRWKNDTSICSPARCTSVSAISPSGRWPTPLQHQFAGLISKSMSLSSLHFVPSRLGTVPYGLIN